MPVKIRLPWKHQNLRPVEYHTDFFPDKFNFRKKILIANFISSMLLRLRLFKINRRWKGRPSDSFEKVKF